MKPFLVLGAVGKNSLLYLSHHDKTATNGEESDGFKGIKSNSALHNSKGYLQCSSWKLQNEILESARLNIMKKLVEEIHEAKMFSIIIEESIDFSTSRKEHLCLTVRYYHNGKVRENFLGIRWLPSQNADDITNTILEATRVIGIDFEKAKMIGQEYRGPNAAVGNKGGVPKAIKDRHPMAFYFHPPAHFFNSAVCNATCVKLVTAAMIQINKIARFLGEFPHRWELLRKAVDKLPLSDGRKQFLYPFCETPWTGETMSFNAFFHLFPAVTIALSQLSLDNENSPEPPLLARKAGNYLDTVFKEQIIKVLLLLKEAFKTLTDISEEFQKMDSRLLPAMERIENLTLRIDDWLKGEGSCTVANIEADYVDLRELIMDFYIRRAPMDFKFEEKIFRPFLKDLKQQIKNYYGFHFPLMAQFAFLLPGKQADFRELSPLVKFYIDNNLISAGIDDVRHEYYQWHKHASAKFGLPVADLIPEAHKMNFKTIADLLQAYVTIPDLAVKRSSLLGAVKDSLQESTSDAQFNALLSIYSNESIECTEEDVLTTFKARQNLLKF